jgi:hypothetical protein
LNGEVSELDLYVHYSSEYEKRAFHLLILFYHALVWYGHQTKSAFVHDVVSDEEDQTIKKGFCIVEGYVVDQSGKKIQGALVSTVSHKRQTLH